MNILEKFCRVSSGFTLAEVLVTLGIIGVVSAMTVPTLMSNHQRTVYVTQLRKVYSEFQQAAISQINSQNAINLMEAGVRSDAAMQTFIKNQFNVVKDCTGDPSDCLADSYKNMDGAAVTSYSDTGAACFALASGATICAKYAPFTLQYLKASDTNADGLDAVKKEFTSKSAIGDLIIDVNGKEGPNILGRDLFLAGILADGTVVSEVSAVMKDTELCVMDPDTGKGSCTNNSCENATGLVSQGPAAQCFDSIIKNNWEMTY